MYKPKYESSEEDIERIKKFNAHLVKSLKERGAFKNLHLVFQNEATCDTPQESS
jgi:endo-1,4-beta-mannosidase